MASIILNKNNFFNNLDIIAKHTKAKDKIALVLKDNAYGHGVVEMATMAQEYGIKKCIVQTEKEALLIESFFEYILVLADFPSVMSDKIHYTINDLYTIHNFPAGTKVELKVDTGMHRNGVKSDALYTAFARIKEQGLILGAVFTHHRSADELTSEWFWQKENFKKVKTQTRELAEIFGFTPLRFHSCNSAALFRESAFDEDMARVGIAAYGCMDLPAALAVKGLRPVLSLKALKISSRFLKKCERVGYGGTYEITEDCVVSNYNFGYGDGFLRTLSNNYKTQQNIPLIGRISMDNSSFVSEDEELLIFENASYVAAFAGTISYEILTSLKSELKREIV
ncbi:MAG TPA: alanine racemase [Sulfurimonas sp. UBA12504]|nr:MAG: alanine racemase [Sulfurimonas sp. GWF2_37_8]DAB30847.1 MAG TPA: alanine racemase [Sulfurimonas sp. UBA12504]